MKTIKFLSVTCCVAAMCLTSCIGDDNDDNRSLTPAEVSQCLTAVKGTHLGQVIYPATNIKDVKDTADTLDISWTISTDSTMTIHDFPSKLLASRIDSINGKELRAALSMAPDQDIECRIGFIDIAPVQWLINPKTPTYQLNTGDGEHKVQVAFYANNTYSFGMYNASKSEFLMQIIEGAIYLDGKLTSYLTADVPFIFVRNK